jgi:hypothetical protein
MRPCCTGAAHAMPFEGRALKEKLVTHAGLHHR